jgi:adenylosuccinate lyase
MDRGAAAGSLEQLDFQLNSLKFFGCKGTPGTGASFMELFDGELEKTLRLELLIAEKMGFDSVYPVSGQTYSRKIDSNILSVLSAIAQSASKFATDIRLLSHLKEVDEPFEDKQVGSSAMAYKRNPIAQRAHMLPCPLRYLRFSQSGDYGATQWFERTLDDSAKRRLSIAAAFLAVDGILSLYINVISGLQVYPKVIARHLADELPFMATENILMYCVKKGGDRQRLHEAIRRHSVEAGKAVKLQGGRNTLLDMILGDPEFHLTEAELTELTDPEKFTGFAAEQTELFLQKYVRPLLEANPDSVKDDISIRV